MRYIKLDENNRVVAVRKAKSIVEGEIQSDIGEQGQIMQEDGTFIDAPIEPIETQPTLEDKVNYLYYKATGVI